MNDRSRVRTAPQLQINHPYPPALRQSLELALREGLTSDSEQAARLHRSHKSIAERWQRIAEGLGMPEGQRRRDRVIVTLFRARHVEYLVVTLALWLGTALLPGADLYRTPRPPRPTRPARERVMERHPGALIDMRALS